MFSEDVFARWSAESVLAFCREKNLLDDISLDDIVRMLSKAPDPPVGWIAFYEQDKDAVAASVENSVPPLPSGRPPLYFEGPYWCEKDIEDDLQIHRDDKCNVERTLALQDDEMCEWLDGFISAILREDEEKVVAGDAENELWKEKRASQLPNK